jgi:hypothetical protein
MQNKITSAIQYLRIVLTKIDLKIYAICVVIASFIWLIMTLSDSYTEQIDFPVSYINYPQGMILVNKPTDEISFNVKSQGFELASVAIANRDSILIDLSTIEYRKTKYGRYVAAIATKVFRYNIMSQLKVDDVGKEFKPDSLYLVFDSLISRDIPIKLNHRLVYEKGYNRYGSIKLVPPSIRVKGPAVLIKKLNTIETDSLILDNIDSDVNKRINLLKKSNYLSYSESSIEVNIKTEKYSEFSVWSPITIKSNVPNLKVKTFPSKVKITFAMALPDYKLLNDTSFMLAVQLDSIDLLQQNKLIIKIEKQPKQIGNIELSSETVDYVILNK